MCSHFVKSICRLFDSSRRSSIIIKEGFNSVVGSGESVSFWRELKWDSVPLNSAFPRIFALATNKVGVIREFGSFVESEWVWNVRLRRPLFDWERDQWKIFLLSLQNVIVRKEIPDVLAWTFSPDAKFSVKSLGGLWKEIGGQEKVLIVHSCGKESALQK